MNRITIEQLMNVTVDRYVMAINVRKQGKGEYYFGMKQFIPKELLSKEILELNPIVEHDVRDNMIYPYTTVYDIVIAELSADELIRFEKEYDIIKQKEWFRPDGGLEYK